jgi:lipopolysaccharide transport system permease protein
MQLYRREALATHFDPRVLANSLWSNRALLRHLAWRNIQLQHKGSALGLVWSILSPVLLFAAYAFVFVVVFEGRFGVVTSETRMDYVLGMFLALVLVQLCLEIVGTAPTAITLHANYVKKVVFPLEVLPASMVAAALFRCVVSLIIVLLTAAIWGPGLTWWATMIIPLLLALALLALGIGWSFAALGVFIRDLASFTQFLTVILMLMSAVFYPLARVPDRFAIVRLNPLAVAAEEARNVVLWHLSPDFGSLGYLAAWGIVSCLAGHAFFRTVKPAFADVL